MNLHSLSIKRKLTLITMLTACIAVVLSSAGFLIYDLTSLRKSLIQDLTTHAEMIGGNAAAALESKDVADATDVLSAVHAEDDVLAAALYGADGRIFATYTRSNAPSLFLPPGPQEDGYHFENGYLEVFHEVTRNGQLMGTIYLQSDMHKWNLRAEQRAIILGLFVLVSALLALLVSSKLQTMISIPILQMEDDMGTVSRMLAEIEQRDTALRGANDELEKRTRELEEEIIQRKETQEELLNAKQAAEEANGAKSTFLANMSHELRTPLNAIIGYSEMLEEETRDLGKLEVVQDLQKIQSAGKHLLSLINDVLDLSKVEAGKMGLYLETFDVAQTIEEIATTVQPSAAKNANTFQVRVASDVGKMRADITKVRQILLNLLSNSCKFTDHGTIILEAERSMADGQDTLQFRVIDTGIGITPEHMEKLFQEFDQGDISVARKYGGSGLGLAISHRFVKLMHGYIRVESQIGKGSTFSVHLPAQVTMTAVEEKTAIESLDSPTASSQVNPDSDTILVIDDDRAVRDLMSRSLTKMGFQVVTAASGREGLRIAKEVHPFVITLDVVMPEVNGWVILNTLKSDSELAKIPVIMVTVVDNETLGFALGASGYLIKPVDKDRLAALLDKHRRVRSSIAKGGRFASRPPA